MRKKITKTLDEIKKDKLLYDEKEIAEESANAAQNGGKYTLWCEDWEPVEEKKVKPLLNIRLKEVKIPIKNGLMAAAGKLKLANFKVLDMTKPYIYFSFFELEFDIIHSFIGGLKAATYEMNYQTFD